MHHNKTLETNSIPVPPMLAGLLKQALGRSGNGFDEGAFLQQLHYWAVNSKTTGWIIDGIKWVYNSLKSWLKQFPWMSEYGLRKVIANLKKLGLIETAQHWLSQYKRVMFYRIDYDRLVAFAGDLCELITSRCAKSDQIDVRSDHTTDPEITPENSFKEQQPGVVGEKNKLLASVSALPVTEDSTGSGKDAVDPGEEESSPASSGNSSEVKADLFPEIREQVAKAISLQPGAALPASLKRAIARFPDRVESAIWYLKHQRERREIQNPAGYLHQTIIEGWELPTVQPSPGSPPDGFSEWFNWAKEQGLVIGSMTIDGVHCTLHSHQDWAKTESLMQMYPITYASS
jgi:hypothetical protein